MPPSRGRATSWHVRVTLETHPRHTRGTPEHHLVPAHARLSTARPQPIVDDSAVVQYILWSSGRGTTRGIVFSKALGVAMDSPLVRQVA